MVAKKIEFPKKIVEHYINSLKTEIVIDGIFLFGSFACGKPTKHSDVDLAVISDDFNKKKYRNRLQWLSRMRDDVSCGVAMDVVGYTPKEFSDIEEYSAIMADAKKRGRWIYKK